MTYQPRKERPMKKTPRKALNGKNSPRSLRLQLLAIIWLLMDRFQPSDLVVGVVWTLVALLYLFIIFDYFTAQDVDLEGKL